MYQKKTLELSSFRTAELLVPENQGSVSLILYVLDGEKLTPSLMKSFEDGPAEKRPALVSISGEQRLSDYTPWPAPALSPRFADFGGQGDAFLRWLTEELMPRTERQLFPQPGGAPSVPFRSALLGYSLGGLLAVYASFVTAVFSDVISVSGSFWYPEWDSFLKTHTPANPKVSYLMLCGQREGAGKKNLQGNAVDRARLTHRLLCEYTRDFPLLLDQGGHHDLVDERLAKAARWLLAKAQDPGRDASGFSGP